MKKILLFIVISLFSISFTGCKKLIDKKKEDMLMNAITNGTWIVEQYLEGTTDVTNSFSGYEFKFSTNGTVTGSNTSETLNGTWTGDVDSRSITSNFPAAGDPVKKLNGTWILTDTYWDYVEASMTTTNGKNQLHLRKKS